MCVLLLVLVFFQLRYWHLTVKSHRAWLKFLEQIINAYGRCMPDLFADLQQLVNKCYKTDPQLYADFHRCLRTHTEDYQDFLVQVVQSTRFPGMSSCEGLTEREKIVHLLTSLDFSNETIGGLLGATRDNIRSTKSRIAHKMYGTGSYHSHLNPTTTERGAAGP